MYCVPGCVIRLRGVRGSVHVMSLEYYTLQTDTTHICCLNGCFWKQGSAVQRSLVSTSVWLEYYLYHSFELYRTATHSLPFVMTWLTSYYAGARRAVQQHACIGREGRIANMYLSHLLLQGPVCGCLSCHVVKSCPPSHEYSA